MKQIKVVCQNPFRVFNQDGELVGEVTNGEELVATLDDESEEYFAKDKGGKEIFVGFLNVAGNMVLDECFELVEEGADKRE